MKLDSASSCSRSRLALPGLLALALAGPAVATRPAHAADPPPVPAPAPTPGGADTPAPDLDLKMNPAVEACMNHHTSAQELRMAGKLLESRQEMLACAAEACPAILQRDCVSWLERIDAQIPSITFRVRVDGRSRTDVQVSIDGVPHPELTQGKAVELNPGKHRLSVVAPGVAPFEEELVWTEGERYRMVEVELSSPGRSAPEVATRRPVPLAAWVLGGVAAAAAINGGIWAASSLSLRRELEDTCAPLCRESRVDDLRRRALVTDLSWGVSAAALIGAATVFVLRPELPVEIEASWLPGGGMGRIRLDAF